jgi:hypothetical protein
MNIVAYGGGVNSTAMLIELHRRKERVDAILFADTGGERPETYASLKQVSEWCVAHGLPEIVTVRKTYKGEPETLERNCERMNMLPSIAYGFKSCSMKYKADPQNKWVNNWRPAKDEWDAGRKIVKLIGYDSGEDRRANIKSDDKYDHRYPLIEWGLWREDCDAIVKSEGLVVGKSSCFFCPSMKKREILELKEKHPDLLERAIAMEQRAQLTTVKGLGRSFSWKSFIENDLAQDRIDFSADIPCGCYDG